MELDEARAWFDFKRMRFRWRQELPGVPAVLRPPPGQTLPLGDVSVGIVIPDVHLGWGNDVFRFNDGDRERRLEQFLDLLLELKAELGAAFTAVQVGDWYDFWRSPGVTALSAKSLIEEQYPGVVSRARLLGLRHCIGNHDAAFATPAVRSGLDIEIVRPIGSSRIVCLHGHDKKTLARIEVDGTWESIGLNILNVVNSTPVVGPLTSWLQKLLDQSFAEPLSATLTSLPWPKALVSGPSGWSAPWRSREGAVELGSAVRGYELCVGEHVSVAIIGHSHRPGISWIPVAGDRRVPIVDVGSWTYGRAEFGVVCQDGVGIAELVG